MSSKREHVTDQREEAYQGVIVVSAPHPSPRPRCQGPFPFQNHRYFCWTGKGDYFIPSYTSGFTGLTRAVRYTDCFEIATDRYELTDSTVPNIIWTRVAWRAPWRQVVEENFEQAVTVPKLAVLRILGICGISRLPAEIAEMVMGYAKSSLLSRYGTAAEFADMLPTLPHNEIHSIPVRHILSWSRDSGLVPCVSVHCEPPIVRITIDANGIQAVERLYGHPKFLTKRVSNCLFVILSITELGNTIAYIRYNRMHLHLRVNRNGLQTWDTPNPPAIMRCTFEPDRIYKETQFKTIYPSQISGNTFYFIHEVLGRIHAHSTSEPFTVEAFRRQ